MQKIWNTTNNQIPKDWAIKTLPEFSRIEMGQSPSSNTYNFNGRGLPFFQGKAEFGEFYPKVNKYCSEPKKIAEEGAVLLSVRAPVGPTNLAKEKSCIGRGLAALHPLDGMDSKFLLFLLRSIEPELSSQGTGSTFKAITKGFVENMAFAIPDIREQEYIITKIEELFSELDSGIASLKTAREQLKIYRQALLKHAFEGKLTEQWRKDNADKLETPEQLLTRIQTERETRYQQQLNDWKQAVKDWEAKGKEGKKPSKPKKLAALKNISKSELSELTPLPIGWSYVRLGHLIDEPTYGTSAKCEYDSGNTGVLRIPNIKSDAIDDGDLKFASFDEGEIKHFALEEGDLLTIRSNGSISLVGTCALVKEKDTKYIFAGYLIRLRPNQSSIHPSFLLAVLTSHLLRRQIETAAKSTSGVNNINSGELQNLIIPIPTIQEQHELLKYLDTSTPSIDATELEIDRQLLKSETLRQSILKKAFSGQLVSSDLNDRSESVKPSRAKAEK